ncbi:hypothetical protein K470DRAFT_260574, partial [Piedraia hortae CBS 480.64]
IETRAKEDVEFGPQDGMPFHEDFGPFIDARVVQLNVNFWQNGVSAARGKRWNPLEVWTMNLAGFSRRVTQFHVSANYYVAVGAKMKVTSMLVGLMPDLVRPQRGVRAFDSRIFYLRDAPFPPSGSDYIPVAGYA